MNYHFLLNQVFAAASPSPSVVPCLPNQLCNPINATDLIDLIHQIGGVLIQLAIPIAVILIIWIGIQFFLAQGNSEKVTRAKSALLWLIVGLAIILIGDGFIALIKSILDLRGP